MHSPAGCRWRAGQTFIHILWRPRVLPIVPRMRENPPKIVPDPDDPRLSSTVSGIDQDGAPVEARVVAERPLTLYLNRQEIVTMMTIGDYPELLAVGYLKNQNMLPAENTVTEVEYDEELDVVVVRTEKPTNYEDKLKKKVRMSGCAQARCSAT